MQLLIVKGVEIVCIKPEGFMLNPSVNRPDNFVLYFKVHFIIHFLFYILLFIACGIKQK